MNAPYRLGSNKMVLLLSVGILATTVCLGADGRPGTATVKAILGQAQLSKAGGPFAPLDPGMVVRPGDVVQTATRSAVDLSLGEIAGTVRLTQSTTMVLETLTFSDAKSGADFDVLLSLRGGEVLGLSKPVPQGSRFEIKVGSGLAQILEGRFRVDGGGQVVVVKGKVLFAHVPKSGEPAAHTLTAPPAVYFDPDAGVQPAPKALQREVINQMRSKLPRR